MPTPHGCLEVAVVPDGSHVVRLAWDDTELLWSTDGPWPRDTRLRCDPLAAWPDEAEVVDAAGVRHVSRRGPSLDVLLDRGVLHRCRFVLGPAAIDDRGSGLPGVDDVVWWQTGSAARGIPPRQRVPTARERGIDRLDVVVDTREQRAWDFSGVADCEVVTRVGKLDAGDYAVVVDGELVAAVERKKGGDFRSGLTTGRLSEQMAVLSTLPRAAVVVESSYARVLNSKRVARGRVADLVAAVQASFPEVPVVFAGSRDGAEEWTWRWLAAAWSHHVDETDDRLAGARRRR